MKILHVISSMGVLSGGPTVSTLLTAQGESNLGLDVEILTYEAQVGDHLISNDPFIHTVPAPVERRFAYSTFYKKALQETTSDLYHIQGIWKYPSICAAAWARKKKKPYVITLRGMLYPQCFEQSEFIKRFSLWLYLASDLQKASCLHATCVEEMEHLRNLGICTPIAVIPNPIQTIGIEKTVYTPEKKCIGYLGRIHPRKRIERLLYAMDMLREQAFELVIIGDGEKSYLQYLKDEVARLKLEHVTFTGFLTGEEKNRALEELSYMIIPSDFENFGNIATEALLRGIPVIASKGTPWEDLNIYHCGWWVDNDVETLTATIRRALSISKEERIAMGIAGKKLIIDKYSLEIIANKMKQLYEWILCKTEKPDFVYLLDEI